MKFENVYQIGFDLAVPEGIDANKVSEFGEYLQEKVINALPNDIGAYCINGTNYAECLTADYDMEDLNEIYRDTKFIYYTLDIRQSEIENTDKFVAEIPIDKDPQEYINEEASTYYAPYSEVQDDGWYFENGCVCVHSPRFKEITEDEYKIMQKFL